MFSEYSRDIALSCSRKLLLITKLRFYIAVTFILLLQYYYNYIHIFCVLDQLNDSAHIQNLRDEKYDIAIVEYFDACGLAILKLIGVEKYIVASAMFVDPTLLEQFGHPTNLAFIPGKI